MGRKSHSQELAIWINGKHAGKWRISAKGESEFKYDQAWAESEEGRPLSLSLPLSLDNAPIKGKSVDCYFDNLLPDSESIRKRLRGRFHSPTSSPFDLLSAIGRDCVGAVQLLPVDEVPHGIHTISARPLSELEIEAILIQTVSPNIAAQSNTEEDLRISIAGAQEKTALLMHKGQLCRPLGATPTTHILKLPLGRVGRMQADLSTSVENEWLCAKILESYSIPTARCEIMQFGSQKVLVVERFDRQLQTSGKYWLRLVQEDFCQATAMPYTMKYESDGGPDIFAIARILRGSVNRNKDLACLLKAQLLFWMLAATDGHAKNFSLRILNQGRYQLTSLYDVISAWPVIGHGVKKLPWQRAKLALSMRGKRKHYLLKDIQRRHFNQTALSCGLGDSAESIINEVITATPGVIEMVQLNLPKDFPQWVLDTILKGLAESARRLEGMSVK